MGCPSSKDIWAFVGFAQLIVRVSSLKILWCCQLGNDLCLAFLGCANVGHGLR